jgi:hypothetical protein
MCEDIRLCIKIDTFLLFQIDNDVEFITVQLIDIKGQIKAFCSDDDTLKNDSFWIFKDWTFTVDVERVIEPYLMRTDTLKVKGIFTWKIECEERVLNGKRILRHKARFLWQNYHA